MIRAQPMDAVVLVGGCDKTVPAPVMGAASASMPAIVLVTGPMMTARYRGERLGACTDCRRFWAKYRAGEVDRDEIETVEGRLATTEGTCAVMGTASTMACLIEVLGMMLPGTAAIPAVHADRLRAAEATGRAAVDSSAGSTTDRIVTQEHRQRAAGAARRRRLDQRHHASGRDGRTARASSSTSTASTPLRRDAGAGRPEADRRGLHGGLLRGRRRRRGSCASCRPLLAPRLPRPSPARRSASGCPRAPSSIRR